MEADRKHERIRLQSTIRITKINNDPDTLYNSIINLEDISVSGIGFNSNAKLKKDHYYNISIELYNKNKIVSLIKITRISKYDNENNTCDYGAEFIGLSEYDKIKIKSYAILDKK